MAVPQSVTTAHAASARTEVALALIMAEWKNGSKMKYHQVEDWFSRLKAWVNPFKEPDRTAEEAEARRMFQVLSREQQLELIKAQLELWTSAVSNKNGVMPVIGTLAAALIVVATLNSTLVPLSTLELKAILSIFFVLIPLCLHYYIKQLEGSAKSSMKIITVYQPTMPNEKIQTTLVRQILSDLPIIIVYAFCGVVFVILFAMWHG